jgi:RNA polymerase sigma-54 factor
MVLTQRLDIRQSQTLIMTPQLQQAIKLLQMSNQELGEFLEKEVEQNPLLERAGDDEPYTDGERAAADEGLSRETLAEPESFAATPSEFDPSPMSGKEIESPATESDSDWADQAESFGNEDYAASTASSGVYDGDDYSAVENIAERPSLREHLLGQIQVDFIDPADRIIAAALVEFLDEAGYLPSDLNLVRAQLGATADRFDHVITRLQAFDPPGIFARSLDECLRLQLRDKNRLDPAMEIMLQHLDLVAKRERPALMKLCGVDAEDLVGMIDEIKLLNPRPALAFASDVAPPLVPDVMLRAQPGGGWHVELNSDNLPRVLANERYYSKIQASARSKADKEYLSDRWQQANWLVKALHQRATTILKVATEIVRQQEQFFVHGVQHLKPLILRDIATAIEMHESTVSRVTQNKFITTPRGMFELKYFFTTALPRSDGGAVMSSESVRDRIKNLIDAEVPKKILSDDTITEILHTEGIDIARRTVAKYREAMHIPTSAQRRRDKR